jgi:hypothetical protein
MSSGACAAEKLRALAAELPMPLAQLVARFCHAEPGIHAHDAAFFLAEASIKLAASARILRWVEVALEPGGELAKSVEGLMCPSLGHYVSLWARTGAALARRGADHEPLASTPSSRWSDAARATIGRFAGAVERARIGPRELGKRAETGGPIGLGELLARYRNRVIGHGAERSRAFYRELSELLGLALVELLSHPTLFGGLRLCLGRDVVDQGRATTMRFDLMGHAGVLLGAAPAGVEAGKLYLASRDGAHVVSLSPLVVHEPAAAGGEPRFGFLNEVALRGQQGVVKRAEHLDYATGHQLEDDVASLAQLLSALRGAEASRDEVAGTVAAVAAGELAAVAEGTPERREASVGDLIADRYRLLERIGEGGMGTVFAAEHVGLGTRCAIKILLPALGRSEELVERFRQEARTTAGIAHPAVVKVTDVGEMAEAAGRVCYLA